MSAEKQKMFSELPVNSSPDLRAGVFISWVFDFEKQKYGIIQRK